MPQERNETYHGEELSYEVPQAKAPKSTRDMMLEEAEYDLRDVMVEERADGLSLKMRDGTYVSAAQPMSKSDFIANWLDGFTLGRIGDHNYFDANAWFEFTNHGTMSVPIMDDEDPTKVLFVIAPLAVPQLTLQERIAVAQAGAKMGHAKHMMERKDSLGAMRHMNQCQEFLNEHLTETAPLLSDFIPRSFWNELGVIPEVRQNLIYCRDYYGLNASHEEDWKLATEIFEDVFYHRDLSPGKLKFMEILTDGKWAQPEYKGLAPEEVVSEVKEKQDTQYIDAKTKSTEIPYDPWSC